MSAGGAELTALRASVEFSARATGVPRFDAGPLARVSGATPSWHMLTFGYAVAARGADWRGLVAIDREGTAPSPSSRG